MNLKTQVTILEALDTQAAQLEQTIAELDANLPTRLLLKYKQFFMNLGKRIHSQGLFWETIDPDVDKVELKILASDTYGECELETIIEQLLFNQGIIYIRSSCIGVCTNKHIYGIRKMRKLRYKRRHFTATDNRFYY
ncbi:hypothetical protein [Pseudoalteromonas galatheae]|uniref:hypothetical protein n=1 Tax=Pseudoalteromonas galatheae TaxID=579562 RepID=UPI0030D0A736